MGSSTIAGVAGTGAAVSEKLALDKLSEKLPEFISNYYGLRTYLEEISRNTSQKLSEIKSIELTYIITRGAEAGVARTSSFSPKTFASAFLEGNFGFCAGTGYSSPSFALAPNPLVTGYNIAFNDGSSITQASGNVEVINKLTQTIGGYDIKNQLVALENTKSSYLNNISCHQNNLNIALGILASAAIGFGISLGLMYISNPIGTKEMVKNTFRRIEGLPKTVERRLGRLYNEKIKSPRSMELIEGYQNCLHGPM
ncbi:MAG TPA: hypothetical protein VJ343_02460 [archaeon]|nr:hypothetical protein [archaeon]